MRLTPAHGCRRHALSQPCRPTRTLTATATAVPAATPATTATAADMVAVMTSTVTAAAAADSAATAAAGAAAAAPNPARPTAPPTMCWRAALTRGSACRSGQMMWRWRWVAQPGPCCASPSLTSCTSSGQTPSAFLWPCEPCLGGRQGAGAAPCTNGADTQAPAGRGRASDCCKRDSAWSREYIAATGAGSGPHQEASTIVLATDTSACGQAVLNISLPSF